jgi:hypothetical protein
MPFIPPMLATRLEDPRRRGPPPGVCLVPVTDDAPALWDTWVGLGGEGWTQ